MKVTKKRQKEFLKYREDNEENYFKLFFRGLSHIWYGIRKNRKSFIREGLIEIFSDPATNTIYPYIPVEIVNKEIELHGGLK